MKKNKLPSLILGLTLILNTGNAWSQVDIAAAEKGAALPKYPVSYEVPTTERIKEVVDRIQKRVVGNAHFYLVDSSTGQRISDFTRLNKNAVLPATASTFIEWSYPNGVSLTACHDLAEVTGDTSYLNYAIRFYDFT